MTAASKKLYVPFRSELSPEIGLVPLPTKVKMNAEVVPFGAISLTSRSPTKVCVPVKLTVTFDTGLLMPVTAKLIWRPVPEQSLSGIAPRFVPVKKFAGVGDGLPDGVGVGIGVRVGTGLGVGVGVAVGVGVGVAVGVGVGLTLCVGDGVGVPVTPFNERVASVIVPVSPWAQSLNFRI